MRLNIKTITIVGTAGLAALTFAACGSKPDAGIAAKVSASNSQAASSVAAAQASRVQAAQAAANAASVAAASEAASESAAASASEAAAASAAAAAARPKAIPGSIAITQDGADAGTVTVSNFRFGQGPLSEYGEAPTKGYYVAFTVRVDSTENGYSVSSDDFYAVEAGQHFNYSSSQYELDNSLEYVTINKGEHAIGTIVFDVPSPHGTLNYSPNYDGAPIGAWKF